MLSFEDIAKIFEEIELRLIASLKRNLHRHKKEESEYNKSWSAWQAEKLRNIEVFRKENQDIIGEYADVIDEETVKLMQEQFAEGEKNVDEIIGIEDTENLSDISKIPDVHFFGVNEKKMKALIQDVTEIEKTVETAAVRMTDDIYRTVLNRVQLSMSTGSMTLTQAIDSSVSEFLERGINYIRYKDGRRVNIADYVRMALRTTSTRAMLQGESKRRSELGIDTVMTSQYGGCSETCEPWQGKIYIDDVFTEWNGETSGDRGKSNYCEKWFTLLSVAIRNGLFHPNCRHTLLTYIDGMTKIPTPIDSTKIKQQRELEQKQRAMERKIRKLKRLSAGTENSETAKKYRKHLQQAQSELNMFVKEHDGVLKRDYSREKYYGDNGIQHIKGSSEITFARQDNEPKINKAFAKELQSEYERFTEMFGELPNLKSVEIAPYYNDKDYGGYNPNSNVITLRGIGGKNGKAFITATALAEKKSGQWSTSSPFHQFRHELAHALQQEMSESDALWVQKLEKIFTLKKSIEKDLTNIDNSDILEFKKKKLSIYGFFDIDEFISESVAEYTNNPLKSRNTAKLVVEILLRKE